MVCEGEDIILLPDQMERWLKRLPILEGENYLYNDHLGNWCCRLSEGVDKQARELMEIEDSLSGFSAVNPGLLTACGQGIRVLGEADSRTLHRFLINSGRRVLPGAVANALTDLRLLGLTNTDLQGRHCLSVDGERVFGHRTDFEQFYSHFNRWLPYKGIMESGIPLHKENLGKLQGYFERCYLPYRPYLKNLYNSNKLRGILDLSNHLKSENGNFK